MATDHPIPEEMVSDLASYLSELSSPPSVQVARVEGESGEHAALFQSGMSLFQSLGCIECHAGERYTSREVFDVGLVDEQGMTRFNPPSLTSVSQRQNSLFHDGRAKSLRSVVEDFKHQLPRQLTAEECQRLVYFLQSL